MSIDFDKLNFANQLVDFFSVHKGEFPYADREVCREIIIELFNERKVGQDQFNLFLIKVLDYSFELRVKDSRLESYHSDHFDCLEFQLLINEEIVVSFKTSTECNEAGCFIRRVKSLDIFAFREELEAFCNFYSIYEKERRESSRRFIECLLNERKQRDDKIYSGLKS